MRFGTRETKNTFIEVYTECYLHFESCRFVKHRTRDFLAVPYNYMSLMTLPIVFDPRLFNRQNLMSVES